MRAGADAGRARCGQGADEARVPPEEVAALVTEPARDEPEAGNSVDAAAGLGSGGGAVSRPTSNVPSAASGGDSSGSRAVSSGGGSSTDARSGGSGVSDGAGSGASEASAADAPQPRDLEAGPPAHLVRALLRAVAADPTYLAERLTTFTVDWWAPLADKHIEALRRKHPGGDPDELRRAVVSSTVRTCIVEGSLIGGPLVVLMPVAFCAALLVQIRMILEMAVLAGRPATDPIRAAEVLVIQGAHPDLESAQDALRASVAGRQADTRKRPGIRALWSMTWRMARLLGLTAPGPETKRSIWVRMRGWLGLGATFVVGTVMPLIWMPYLGDAYRRSTLDLAHRATLAYEGTDRGIRKPGKRGFAAPAMTGAVIRALLAVAGTVLLVVLLVALDVRVAGGRWPTVIIGLAAAAVVTSLVWYLPWRRRHKGRG